MSQETLTVRGYLMVFGVLLGLTAATVVVALLDLGRMNLPVALVIAGVKATLVGMYFMHLRWSDRPTRAFALLGLLGLLVLLSVMTDYVDRPGAP